MHHISWLDSTNPHIAEYIQKRLVTVLRIWRADPHVYQDQITNNIDPTVILLYLNTFSDFLVTQKFISLFFQDSEFKNKIKTS